MLDYLKPRVEVADKYQAGLDGKGSVVGTETFDNLKPSSFSETMSFDATFDKKGVISGRYSGTLGISGADLYGGAGGAGNYIVTFAASGYTLDLRHGDSIPGLNYFGMQLSALDAGNMLEFRRNNETIYTYTPNMLIKSLGSCKDGNAYCGNPSEPTQNAGQQYAFINFFDTNGYFDQVRFQQIGGGGFESDNHTVGYRPPSSDTSTRFAFISVPEPISLGMLGTGLLCLGVLRTRQAARNLKLSWRANGLNTGEEAQHVGQPTRNDA